MPDVLRTLRHAHRLRLHVCQTVGANDVVDTEAHVRCPSKRRIVPLSDCSACGFATDESLRSDSSEVVCRHLARSESLVEHGPPRAVVTALRGTTIGALLEPEITAVRDAALATLDALPGTERPIVVVDRDTRPIGFARESPDGLSLEPLNYTLPDTASIFVGLSLLVREQLPVVPIINDNGRLVGMLRIENVLRWLITVPSDEMF